MLKKILIFTSLITILNFSRTDAVCLSTKSYKDGYPVFELWNKGNITEFSVSQDINNLLPLHYIVSPNRRIIGWSSPIQGKESLYSFNKIKQPVDSKKSIFIAQGNSQPATHNTPTFYTIVKAWEIKPHHAPIYLSWTADKGLYPQTGPWQGKLNYTESCLKMDGNIKADKITDVTAKVHKIYRDKAEAEMRKKEAEEKKKLEAEKKLLESGPCVDAFNVLMTKAWEAGQLKGAAKATAEHKLKAENEKFIQRCSPKCATEFDKVARTARIAGGFLSIARDNVFLEQQKRFELQSEDFIKKCLPSSSAGSAGRKMSVSKK